MGQVLHGSARTTEAVCRAIQHSQESLRALAKRYGVNQKTIAKWKRRTATAGAAIGPVAATSPARLSVPALIGVRKKSMGWSGPCRPRSPPMHARR